MGTDSTDDQVWRRVLEGDSRSFGLLFDRHRNRVFRHLLWVGSERSNAEDLTATVFLELWRHRATARIVDESLLPWLLATATNVARNSERATRRYRRLLATLPEPQAAPDPIELAEARMAFSARAAPIADAVRALPLIDQQLILGTVLEGLTLEQAAASVGLSYGAAKTRLSRARRRLADASIDIDPLGATS